MINYKRVFAARFFTKNCQIMRNILTYKRILENIHVSHLPKLKEIEMNIIQPPERLV